MDGSHWCQCTQSFFKDPGSRESWLEYVLGVNCYCTDIRKTPVGVNVGQAHVSPWFGSKVISKLWMLERGDLTMGNDVDSCTLHKKKVAFSTGCIWNIVGPGAEPCSTSQTIICSSLLNWHFPLLLGRDASKIYCSPCFQGFPVNWWWPMIPCAHTGVYRWIW